MPYNPSVVDRSGEIRAQGLLSAAQSIANSATKAISSYVSASQEAKTLSAQNKALETLFKTGGGSFGLKAEDLDRALVTSPDETPRDRNARLTSMLQGAMTTRELQSRQIQDELLRAQVQDLTSRAKQRQQEQIALQGAFSPVLREDARGLDAYLNAGGVDPQMMEALSRIAKPRAGAGGYETLDIPGVGKIVVDASTRVPLDSGKIVKPPANMYPTGPELSSDGRYQRSGASEEWKPVTEKKNDEKALSAQELQQVQALQQSGRDLDTLEAAFAEIGDPDWGGPVSGRLRSLVSAGTDPNVSRIDNLVNAATPNLARGVFREVGVLTDDDVKRYRKLLPSQNDTAEQRASKFKDLRARLQLTTRETLGALRAAGRDVTALEARLVGSSENDTGTGMFKDADGTSLPIINVRGRPGVIKGGRFYPITK